MFSAIEDVTEIIGFFIYSFKISQENVGGNRERDGVAVLSPIPSRYPWGERERNKPRALAEGERDAIRATVAAAVEKRGAASVAKLLGVHRPTLYSYLARVRSSNNVRRARP